MALEQSNIKRIFFGSSIQEINQTASAVLRDATGRVSVSKSDGKTTQGSCVLFSNRYFVLTCAHVVKDGVEIVVNFARSPSMPARVVIVDDRKDLAVLELAGHSWEETHSVRYLRLAPQVSQGDLSYCAGYDSNGFQFTTGNVQSSDSALKLVVTNLTDHGTSGGPCVGYSYFNLFGIIKEDYGVSHHRTTLIPPLTILYFFEESIKAGAHIPVIEPFNESQNYF